MSLFKLLFVGLFLFIGAGCGAVGEAASPANTQATLPPPVIAEAIASTATPMATAAVAAKATAVASPTPSVTPLPTPQPTATPAPPNFTNLPDADIAAEAAAYDVDVIVLDGRNTGVWQYPDRSFLHPVAAAVLAETAYLIDGGRVLALDLSEPTPPRLLLQPGDTIGESLVMEPLDLSVADDQLLVLDRVGDIYRYDPMVDTWIIDRADRGVGNRGAGQSSGHYYVAVAGADNGRYLLETNYKYALGYQAGAERHQSLWPLLDIRAVDVAVLTTLDRERVYVLGADSNTLAGSLALYEDTAYVRAFRANVPMPGPRQLVATETAVYVLDQDGRRLLQFEPGAGRLQQVYQLPQAQPVSAFWADENGRFFLAGADRLYFFQQPGKTAHVPAGGPTLSGPQPHDPVWLSSLDGLALPIPGSPLTVRDFQLPGAPRHYRLGIHEGLDFYWQRGTVVTAVADGVVIRANPEFEQPASAEILAWQEAVQAAGVTTDDALDFYRGRQVWLQHDNDLVTRYVHLDSIAEGVAVGTAVVQGQPIGTVGNSGSPSSLTSVDADVHLHFELWAGDQFYLGQYLRPIETRELLEDAFFVRQMSE